MEKKINLPIEVFPDKISEYITKISDINKINTNIVASSILNAAGFVLSNSYGVSVRGGWIERSNLWTLISLSSGMGKSVIMRDVYKPILDYQEKLIQINQSHNGLVNRFNKHVKEKKINIDAIDFTMGAYPELRNWLINNNLDPDRIPQHIKPINLFSDDFTFEKLLTMIVDNQGHSFLIRADEILGTFKMFNRYHKGGNDEETLLKLWGYDTVKRDRIGDKNKDDASCFIINPTVSLFGATQKEMLFEMYTENRIKNGNVFRFLFSVDNSISTKNVFKSKEIIENILSPFLEYYLLMFSAGKTNIMLEMEEGSIDFLDTWRDECIDKYVTSNIVNIETFNGIMGKMDSYIIRIAIIINRLYNYYDYENTKISIEDLKRSAKIIDYYFHEIIYVLDYTGIFYYKFLKNEEEINFYEKYTSQSLPFFEFIKAMETTLSYSQKEATKKLIKWQENGIIKRNSKGIIYKNIK